MKRLLFLCFFFYNCIVLKAQDAGEYTHTDQQALLIPVAKTYSTDSIAAYIISNFKTNNERLRAIYIWVTANIRYDPDSMYVINSDRDTSARITAALRRRKGVCENYAAIFNDIVVKTGIPSYIVSGYTKQGGSIDRSGHTWCAVYLNDEWYFCDPTWDEGIRGLPRWFLVPPSVFIESHMPFDPIWQLLDNPRSHKEFYAGRSFFKKKNTIYNSRDSISAYLRSGSQEQLQAAAARIQDAGLENQLLVNRLRYVKMLININREEKDMNLYNAAVKDLNNANTIFNNYIAYRNMRFLPARPDAGLNAMLDPVDSIISSANKKLDELAASATDLQYDPGLLKYKFSALKNKLQEQKQFLKQYLTTPPPLRETLFYK